MMNNLKIEKGGVEMKTAENRMYLYALMELNNKKEGLVDKVFTELISKVLQVISVGLAEQLLDKLSELDEKIKENRTNLLNRDY